MESLKRIGLYGISGIGKTTILKEVSKLTSNIIWLEGAKLVINAAEVTLIEFKKMTDREKYFFREKAIEEAFKIQEKGKKHIIIDGHLVFAKGENEFENVMTEKDATFYTDYIYLKLSPEIILKRHQNDKDRKRNYSANLISNWMEFELQELKKLCKNSNLNLQLLESENNQECVDFICNYIEA
jgi:adenylate kinase